MTAVGISGIRSRSGVLTRDILSIEMEGLSQTQMILDSLLVSIENGTEGVTMLILN